MQDACLGGSLELPLCILRLLFTAPDLHPGLPSQAQTTPGLPSMDATAALPSFDLCEDLVISVLLAQHGPGSSADMATTTVEASSPSYMQQSLVSLDDIGNQVSQRSDF